MSVDEEVNRYQKILEDWRPGPGSRPGSRSGGSLRTVAAGSTRPAHQTQTTPPPAPHGLTSPGAILLINERTPAVYLKPVPEKEYHLIQMLCPNGVVKIQGVALQAHQFEEVGSLPSPYFDEMQRASTWDRDLIVFHCYRYEDAARIPRPAEGDHAGTAPESQTESFVTEPPISATPAPAGGGLRRGQRLQIRFGNNTWEAVYWGRDDQNHVVAHKTYQTWALMHLELDRFSNSMVADPAIDETLIQEIEKDLTGAG